MESILILLGLFVLATPIMALVSLVKISGLKFRVDQLEKKLRSQQETLMQLQVQPLTEAQMKKTPKAYGEDVQNTSETKSAPMPGDKEVKSNQEACENDLENVVQDFKQAVDGAATGVSQAAVVQNPVAVVAPEELEKIKVKVEEAALQMQRTLAVTAVPAARLGAQEKREDVTENLKESLGEGLKEEEGESGKVQAKSEVVKNEVMDESVETQGRGHPDEVKRPHRQEQKAAQEAEHSVWAGWAQSGLAMLKRWFTTGNVPVKIGVLVLFAGVAALLKYVTDQGWIYFSMQARLAVISAVSLGALAFAWRKRSEHRTFSLSVQGGSIGILLLTAFAAFKLYGFIGAGPAFAITIALVALMGVLAVAQDAMILAVFAVFAGFMAPIWLSTGSQNHVALFSYYAVLNASILAMSWWRSWRYLNALGFAFTFGIGTLWGVLQYQPEKFATTEPFLVLFFMFYLLIPILYARRFAGSRRDMVDALLVFGAPLIAFSLQATLLQDNHYALAANALGLGVIYAGLAWGLRLRDRFKEFVPAYTALAGGFLTLAVPLAFSAQQTSCIYALEGAVNRRWIATVGSCVVCFSYVFAGAQAQAEWLPVANPTLINMLMIAAAGFFSAWSYYHYSKAFGMRQGKVTRILPTAQSAWDVVFTFYLWGLCWWCAAWVREIGVFAANMHYADWGILLAVVTAWLAAEVNRRFKKYSGPDGGCGHDAGQMLEDHESVYGKTAGVWFLESTVVAGLLLPIVLCLWQGILHTNPMAGWGWLGWLAFGVLGYRSIYCWKLQGHGECDGVAHIAQRVQLAWWPTWALVATMVARWIVVEFRVDLGWNTGCIHTVSEK